MTATASEVEFHPGRGWLTAEFGLVKYVNQNDANGYYKALGLSPNATRDEIKAAYRRLAKKLYPDFDGDEELFRFITDIASVLLDDKSKVDYDSVDGDSIYLGSMEREELARSGFFNKHQEKQREEQHWACWTSPGFPPGRDTDEWIELCREVSPAVGYRGTIRVGILQGGQHWPCDPSYPWGVLIGAGHAFVVFQRGVEPNRLTALSAMIEWQSHLLNQKESTSCQ